MMTKYLVTLRPIEPYFFGTEETFRFDERSKYFVSSRYIPQQTTIVGMMRYVLLEKYKLLNNDRNYSGKVKQIEEAIGKGTYEPGRTKSLGKIESISPIFIIDSNKAIFLPLPLNHVTSNRVYTAMKNNSMDALAKQFNAKETVDMDFVNVETGHIIRKNDLFNTTIRVGIDINHNDSAFFKKECVIMKSEYKFALIAEINDDELNGYSSACYMGRCKSAFDLKIEETQLDLEKSIKLECKGCYYAYSDIVLKTHLEIDDKGNYVDNITHDPKIAMVKTGRLRYLKTQIEKDGIMKTQNILKSTSQHCIISAGSIFYWDIRNNGYFDEDHFGYNKIIEL